MNKYDYCKYEIKDRLDLRDVFIFYGFPLNQSGFCSCPFHSEKTPSCKVSEKVYHCFGCNSSGDVIDFVKKLFDLDYITALKRLNDDFALNLPLGAKKLTADQLRHSLKVKTQISTNKQRLRSLEDKYWLLYDKKLNYEEIMENQNPILNGDVMLITNEYVEAVAMLPKIEYELDLIGGEIYEFRHKQNKIS